MVKTCAADITSEASTDRCERLHDRWLKIRQLK